jgi:hypothetical protein
MAVPSRSEIPLNTSLLQRDELPGLLTIAQTSINEAIPDEILKPALTTPPFIPIPGALNLRDLGLIPSPKIKKSLIYRSGALHHLPKNSIPLLRSTLNLNTVFDFRTAREREKYPEPEIEGVNQVWTTATDTEKRAVPAEFKGDGGMAGYNKMYGDGLRIYAAAYKQVLEFLRDEKDKPILFHCSGTIPPPISPSSSNMQKHSWQGPNWHPVSPSSDSRRSFP